MNLPHNILLILSFVSITVSLNTYGQSGKKKIPVTNVVGMTFKDAKELLKNKNSGVGAIVYNSELDNFDSLIVYNQYPPAKNDKGAQNFIQKGQFVDLWIARQKSLNDTLKTSVRRVTHRSVSHKSE